MLSNRDDHEARDESRSLRIYVYSDAKKRNEVAPQSASRFEVAPSVVRHCASPLSHHSRRHLLRISSRKATAAPASDLFSGSFLREHLASYLRSWEHPPGLYAGF
ncbi:MAG TPA: hypothetical protein VJM47_03940 [Nitrosospira sp.]|nr:hypothetical protein [Nitrosospira sp.]